MIDRRSVVVAGAAAAATTGAVSSFPSPAIAQSAPELKWRLTSSFPKSLDTIYGAAVVFAKALAESSDGKFQVQVFAAGEIVPALQALDAVSNNTVEMCHTASYYFWGKDPTFALGTAIPFGLNARLQNAWLYEGGGTELLNDFYRKFSVHALPCGNTGCQMGGWFRKEIKSVADLSGVKMRIGGMGGKIMEKLGVVPQQLAGGDIYPALEKGTVDAAEWVGPYDDEKLGFFKVAPFYYYPGWWEAGPSLHVMTNLGEWEKLPKGYKAQVANAAALANSVMMARYDTLNPPALRKLVANGAQLKAYPQDIIQAAYAASQDLYAELSAANADFKKVFESWSAYRANGYLWWQVAELTMDALMVRARPQA